MMRVVLTVAMVFFSLATCGLAWASPVTYDFAGTVTEVDPSLSGIFDTSQTLSGSFTYESSTAGVLFGSEASGFSDYVMALTAFTMTVGSYTASPPFGTDVLSLIQVVNQFPIDFPSDRFVVASRLTGTQFNGFNPLSFLSFDDESGGAFSDTKLENVGDLTGWTTQPNHNGNWYLAFSRDGSSPRVSGSLTSLTLVTVPAPGTLALIGSGGAVLTAVTIRRRTSRKERRSVSRQEVR